MFRFAVLLTFLALVCCKSVQKRDIERDTNFHAIGPTVKPEQAHLYRYQVALGKNCGLLCGGTIISDRLILTAAHCIFGYDPRELTVKAGIINADDNKNAQIREVSAIKIHRSYHPEIKSITFDIALLLLEEPLDLTRLTVAKLPPAGANFDGEIFETSGWGNSRNLTYALFTVNNSISVCESDYSKLCGDPYPDMRTYPRDSGGPAVIRSGNEVTLIGVVSGLAGVEYFFANVANLRTWIDEAISEITVFSKVTNQYVQNVPKHNCPH